MLRIITGGTHSNRDSLFVEEIKKASRNDRDILVIIPDQFSFEYDKKLYNLLGVRAFNRIQTGGFNRLAELIAKKYGKNSKENADDNAKIITMYKSIKRLKAEGDVKFYSKALKKPSFIKDSINLVDELVRSGITADDLRIASEQTEGTLQLKLFDMSRLFALYFDELDKAGLKDSLSSLGEFYELASANDFFKGKYIFIDAFTDFSVDEQKLISCMLSQSAQLTVSIVNSHDNKARLCQSAFGETVRTVQALKNIAMAQNVSIEEIDVTDSYHDCSDEIIYIDRNLFCSGVDKSENSANVKLVSATDIYEETEFLCSEISRLVREAGYNYKDIAVLSGNLNEISPVLEGTFERYEIPFFIDSDKGAGQSALVIYLKSLLDCVITRKWNTEKLMRYVKSPLSVFLDYDINDIENYCIAWSVEGEMWDSAFTAKPQDNAALSRINETRKQIIEPLSVFKKSSANTTAKEICLAFYALLEKIKLSEQMFSRIKLASSESENDLELAREYKMLWKMVLSAVAVIYSRIGDEKISLREFSDILSLMISDMTVSKPPQTVDCVRIASTDHSRLSDVKVTFVIEANENIFPAEIKNKGLLTRNDKKKLESLKLNVSSNPIRQLESERLNVYLALTMPQEKLYVTYSESNLKGESKRPSSVISILMQMFDIQVQKVQDIPIDFFCTSYRTAFYKLLEKSTDRDALTASVRESLNFSELYRQKLDYISDISKKKEHSISEELAKKLFFEKDIRLSPTKLTQYYECPFSYFCKYGLKLKAPSVVEIGSMNIGNIIHSCFERIMSKTDESNEKSYDEGFTKLTDDEIKDRIHQEFKKYLDNKLGGDFGKTPSFIAALKRLESSAFYMIKNIQTELSDSLFVPKAFEYELIKENGESILQIKVDDDIRINIVGTIDRADVFTADNGDKYLRIIDYKTGGTYLNLEELYNGLNLQMLIYLLAVTQSHNKLNINGDLKPFAILYSHIKFPAASFTPSEIEQAVTEGTIDDKIMRKRASVCKPDGLVVENEFTFEAFNKHFDGAFTPFTFAKKGGLTSTSAQPVSEEYFLGLEQFALQKIYEMAKKLKCGEIIADPIKTAKSLKCTYCEYWSICGNSSPKNPRTTNKSDVEKLDNEVKNIIEQNKK
ncbi:MAG: PD-(D/E)XK nuclease family protein [Ruminococcus sp.]|nr:PD-(D/E)XK nuclease family protein [Ruminococcus sp.]